MEKRYKDMGSISDKLEYLIDTKEEIRSAINDKGVAVDTTIPFREYGDKIRDIPTTINGSYCRQYIPENIIASHSTISITGQVT